MKIEKRNMNNMKECISGRYASPIGLMAYVFNKDGFLLSVDYVEEFRAKSCIEKNLQINKNVYCVKFVKQLNEYFFKQRKKFDIKINIDLLSGTSFQKKVWKELMNIPYGKTCSYKDIAKKIGNPNASRAVGGANNKNPIAIIIPCHRVVGAKGKLFGYAGGVYKKKFLLDLEEKKILTNF